MNTIEHSAIDELRLHPLQEKVYGRETVDLALVESIREIGIITPLIIDTDQRILSGSRRWRAALELKLSDIPVHRFAGSELEAKSLLINANLQREKSAGQKAREAAELLRIEKARAAEREKAGVTLGSQVAKGRASEIVAKLTGQSRATVEKQAEIVEKAESGSKPAMEVLEMLDAGESNLAEAYRNLQEREKWEKERQDESEAVEEDETPVWTKEDEERFEERMRGHRERKQREEIRQSQAAARSSRLAEVANEIVSAGLKKLAMTRHPDHGGSVEEMQLLNEAVHWLRQQISVHGGATVS